MFALKHSEVDHSISLSYLSWEMCILNCVWRHSHYKECCH